MRRKAGVGLGIANRRQAAQQLAAHGFYVFPLLPDAKLPIGLLDHFKVVATRKVEKIAGWWTCDVMGLEQPYNVGVSTHRFTDENGEHWHLIVVDVDNKDGRDGDADILGLELDGKDLPDTFEQSTPSGGRHLIFRSRVAVGNNSHKLATGLDVRGVGGLVVGVGSVVPLGVYTATFRAVAEAPRWLIDACGERTESTLSSQSEVPHNLNSDYAEARAKKYLLQQPGVDQGARGSTAYRLACYLKDLGVSSFTAYELMSEWAERCDPPMPDDDLAISVENAYKYGRDAQGSAAPEAHFTELPDEPPPPPLVEDKLSPVEELNRDYAFVLTGGGHHIIREKPKGIEHINELSFHRYFASRVVSIGNGKTEALTRIWMNSPKRRSYDGFCFRPGLEPEAGYYNLWRGFSVQPADTGTQEAKDSVAAFLEHAEDNVCVGDHELFVWLMTYFAHLVQRPWEKPLVALVMRGEKGVGKNALVDRVGHLLGNHHLTVSDRRYLIGNFNSHLENCLLLTLDEAFWSGDKQAEGMLKNLITGSHHVVEQKGREPYKVENCTRVCILGNERWLVPATQDERRFAVFDVGSARRQHNKYFHDMRVGMERGGYALLLRYLLDWDLSQADPNRAPQTSGLLGQKNETLEPLAQWWQDCLAEGEIVCSEIRGWPKEVSKRDMRDSFGRYLKNRQIKSRVPGAIAFGRVVKDFLPSLVGDQKVKEGDHYVNCYQLPPLKRARAEFEAQIGGAIRWDE